MAVLPENLIKEFAKVTNDKSKTKNETFLYGTVHIADNHMDVVIDGANVPTPCTTTVSVEDGDRVLLMIKDRQAVITANITRPSITTDTLLAGTIIAKDQYKIYALWKGEIIEINFAEIDKSQWVDPSDPDYDPETEIDKSIWLGDDGPFAQVSIRSNFFTAHNIEADGYVMSPNFINTSDRDLKHDIDDTDVNNALALINAIKHRKFVWNDSEKEETIGYIAQEMGEIDPDLLVKTTKSCAVNTTHLIALATKSIQELSSKVDELERKVIQLESERDQKLSDEE